MIASSFRTSVSSSAASIILKVAAPSTSKIMARSYSRTVNNLRRCCVPSCCPGWYSIDEISTPNGGSRVIQTVLGSLEKELADKDGDKSLQLGINVKEDSCSDKVVVQYTDGTTLGCDMPTALRLLGKMGDNHLYPKSAFEAAKVDFVLDLANKVSISGEVSAAFGDAGDLRAELNEIVQKNNGESVTVADIFAKDVLSK